MHLGIPKPTCIRVIIHQPHQLTSVLECLIQTHRNARHPTGPCRPAPLRIPLRIPYTNSSERSSSNWPLPSCPSQNPPSHVRPPGARGGSARLQRYRLDARSEAQCSTESLLQHCCLGRLMQAPGVAQGRRLCPLVQPEFINGLRWLAELTAKRCVSADLCRFYVHLQREAGHILR